MHRLDSMHTSGHTTINNEYLSSDRISTAEGDQLISDVLRTRCSTPYDLTPRQLEHLFRKALRHASIFYQSRCDTVDHHVWGKGNCQAASEVNQPCFARRIGDTATPRVYSPQRGDVHDPSCCMRTQVRGKGSCVQVRNDLLIRITPVAATGTASHALPDACCGPSAPLPGLAGTTDMGGGAFGPARRDAGVGLNGGSFLRDARRQTPAVSHRCRLYGKRKSIRREHQAARSGTIKRNTIGVSNGCAKGQCSLWDELTTIPKPELAHPASSSIKALASFKSTVSNPSVNQPYTATRAAYRLPDACPGSSRGPQPEVK